MNSSRAFSGRARFSKGGHRFQSGGAPRGPKVKSVFDSIKLPHLEEKSVADYLKGLQEQESQKRLVSKALSAGIDESRNNAKLLENYFQILDQKARSHSRLQNTDSLMYLKSCVDDVFSKKSILFCIDVEAFEFNQNFVTEIGISVYDPTSQGGSVIPQALNVHIVVEEYVRHTNGKFVPDNKDKFLGGESLLMEAYDAVVLVQLLINYYFVNVVKETGLKCILLGHDLRGDASWFTKMGLKFPKGHQTMDTQRLWGTTHGASGNSLSRILRYLDIPHAYLHNAGNDAYYTTILCLSLCDPHMRLAKNLDDTIPIEIPEEEDSEIILVTDADGSSETRQSRQQQQQKTEHKKRKGRGSRVFETMGYTSNLTAADAIQAIFQKKHFGV